MFPNNALVLYVVYQPPVNEQGRATPAYFEQEEFIESTIIPTMEAELTTQFTQPVVAVMPQT